MAFHYSPKITTDGLSIYLDAANAYSYSGSGSDWYDIGRRGASGSMQAGFAYDSASRSFYNASGVSTTATWITMTPTLSISDQSKYSLEFVVRLRPNAENQYHSLCGTGNSSSPWVGIYGGPTSWYMFFRDASTSTYINSSTITSYNIYSKAATLCFTFGIDRTVSFYLNGSLISSTLAPDTSLTINMLAGGYFSISHLNRWPLQGYFYMFRMYDKTLDAAEVSKNHLALSSRFGI